MVIVAVDDEKPARILLENTLKAVRPEADIHMFSTPEELLEYVEEHSADIAVLDICMYSDLNGVTLAKRLKEINTKINNRTTFLILRFLFFLFTCLNRLSSIVNVFSSN